MGSMNPTFIREYDLYMAPLPQPEALGGLFVKAGQWLANMAATPLVWDLGALGDLGIHGASLPSRSGPITWRNFRIVRQKIATPMSRLCWRPEMAGVPPQPQPVCDAKLLWTRFEGGVWKELQGSSGSSNALFFLGIESLFECQDIFLEFEFDPVASASIAQVLDAFVNAFVKCRQETKEDNNEWKLLHIKSQKETNWVPLIQYWVPSHN